MPKYRVYLQTIANTVIEVEADNKDEALDAAHNESMPILGVCCAGWGKTGQNLELGDDWEIPSTLTLEESVEEISV